jgi:hypothetical protein
MAALSVSIAVCVSSFAAVFTSAIIFLASIVSGLFGLPPGLGHVPGRQLVNLRPPLGILARLSFACCLPALQRGEGANNG